MSAKLRVVWMAAGCAPGVRTIARSILFHCRTGLRVETAGPSLEGCSSSVGAPKDFGTCAERLAHSRVSVTRIFDIYILRSRCLMRKRQRWSRHKLVTDICPCLNPLAPVQTGELQEKFPTDDFC